MTNSSSLLIYVIRNYVPSVGRNANGTQRLPGSARKPPIYQCPYHDSYFQRNPRNSESTSPNPIEIYSILQIGKLVMEERQRSYPRETVARAAIVIDYRI